MTETQPKPTLIIGLVGLAGSGKDTVAGMLLRLWAERGMKSMRIAFADPIRTMCFDLLLHAQIGRAHV